MTPEPTTKKTRNKKKYTPKPPKRVPVPIDVQQETAERVLLPRLIHTIFTHKPTSHNALTRHFSDDHGWTISPTRMRNQMNLLGITLTTYPVWTRNGEPLTPTQPDDGEQLPLFDNERPDYKPRIPDTDAPPNTPPQQVPAFGGRQHNPPRGNIGIPQPFGPGT